MRSSTDLVLVSNGYCFICLHKGPNVRSKSSGANDDLPLHSLQLLSRYLGVDLKTLFHRSRQQTLPSPQLLATIEKSKLRVELCEECAYLANKFSDLHSQLEKAKMEMEHCLQLVHGKLSSDADDKKTEQFLKFRNSSANNSRMRGLLEMVTALRTETLEKCSQKLNKVTPRVQIKRCKFENIPAKIFTPKIESEDPPENSLMDWVPSNPNSKIGVNSPIVIAPLHGEVGKRGNSSMWSIIDSKSGKRKCKLCPNVYFSQPAFQNHYAKIHLQLRYKCPVPLCGKIFKSKTGFYLHNKTTHVRIRFRCARCGKTFAQKTTLKKHMKEKDCTRVKVKLIPRSTPKKHNPDEYQAVAPPTSPPRKGHTYPVTLDSKTGRPKCFVCNEAFVNYRALKGHYKSAHLKERFTCEECSLEFPRRDNYLRHYRTAHVVREKARFSCQGCEKMFWRKDHLILHESVCHALTVTSLLKTNDEVSGNYEIDQEQESGTAQQLPLGLNSVIDIGEVKLERF